jgi:hypothetical protein
MHPGVLGAGQAEVKLGNIGPPSVFLWKSNADHPLSLYKMHMVLDNVPIHIPYSPLVRTTICRRFAIEPKSDLVPQQVSTELLKNFLNFYENNLDEADTPPFVSELLPEVGALDSIIVIVVALQTDPIHTFLEERQGWNYRINTTQSCLTAGEVSRDTYSILANYCGERAEGDGINPMRCSMSELGQR